MTTPLDGPGGFATSTAPDPSSNSSADHVPHSDSVSRAVERFRASLDRFPVAAILADARADDQPIVYCNDAFVELTGYPREDILGRNCRFLQGPDTDKRAVRDLRESIDQGEAVGTDLVNYRRDGTTFINSLVIVPIRDSQGLALYMGVQSSGDMPIEIEL